jgi:hypothetical protein
MRFDTSLRPWLLGAFATALFGAALVAQTPAAPATTQYRGRLLGVFNAQTGDPIEGAEVIDLFSKTKALTTATGTITLSFLPEGGSMIRVTKIGFAPETNVVPITPADTTPFMIMLRPIAQTLPTVVTKDSSAPLLAPGLREFEERRRSGVGGHFITEQELRKNDTKNMTYMVRQLPGVQIDCPRGLSHQPACFAYSGRQASKYAFKGGQCRMDVYLDGAALSDPNLNDLRVDSFAAVEFYSGAGSIPVKYNRTGSSCGVLLFWTRVR